MAKVRDFVDRYLTGVSFPSIGILDIIEIGILTFLDNTSAVLSSLPNVEQNTILL